MSAAIGNRKRRMVCVHVTDADSPSRLCRFVGHAFWGWSEHDGHGLNYESKTCQRCGYGESWRRHDALKVYEDRAVEAARAGGGL